VADENKRIDIPVFYSQVNCLIVKISATSRENRMQLRVSAAVSDHRYLTRGGD
jgi:hypothetical protein